MKHITFLFLAFMAIAMAGCSSSKEITEADIYRHDVAATQLKEQSFTMTANRLTLDKRIFPSVSPATNFIQVDGDQAVVQINPGISGGPNGIGGFTVKGTVTGYEVKAKDNGAVSVKFHVNAVVGSCTVFINLPKNGYVASATIHNTLRGKNANIHGEINTLGSQVFTGRSIP